MRVSNSSKPKAILLRLNSARADAEYSPMAGHDRADQAITSLRPYDVYFRQPQKGFGSSERRPELTSQPGFK